MTARLPTVTSDAVCRCVRPTVTVRSCFWAKSASRLIVTANLRLQFHEIQWKNSLLNDIIEGFALFDQVRIVLHVTGRRPQVDDARGLRTNLQEHNQELQQEPACPNV